MQIAITPDIRLFVDIEGPGRSSRCPPEDWTLDTFADEVVRLSDAQGITRPIVLGQSFGGFVREGYPPKNSTT